MNSNLTWLLLSGLVSAAVSALFTYIFTRSLQRDEADTKVALAKLQNQFEQSQRRVQAELEHSEFVTRAHFDTEFEAMKQVFAHLSTVSLCINGIRPIMTSDPTQYDFEGRLQKLCSAYDALTRNSEAMLPFYSAELYDAVDQCQRAASSEINSLNTSIRPFDLEGLEGTRNRDWFAKGYRRAAATIRERISKLAILQS